MMLGYVRIERWLFHTAVPEILKFLHIPFPFTPAFRFLHFLGPSHFELIFKLYTSTLSPFFDLGVPLDDRYEPNACRIGTEKTAHTFWFTTPYWTILVYVPVFSWKHTFLSRVWCKCLDFSSHNALIPAFSRSTLEMPGARRWLWKQPWKGASFICSLRFGEFQRNLCWNVTVIQTDLLIIRSTCVKGGQIHQQTPTSVDSSATLRIWMWSLASLDSKTGSNMKKSCPRDHGILSARSRNMQEASTKKLEEQHEQQHYHTEDHTLPVLVVLLRRQMLRAHKAEGYPHEGLHWWIA